MALAPGRDIIAKSLFFREADQSLWAAIASFLNSPHPARRSRSRVGVTVEIAFTSSANELAFCATYELLM